MNDWVVPRLEWNDAYRPDRGRVLTAAEMEKIKTFQRYADVDENFVAARTLPGVHAKGAFLTRGSGHNRFGVYTEHQDEYQEVLDRLAKKHQAAAQFVPAPVIERRAGAQIGVVTVGSGDPAVREGLALLARRGIIADYLRVRGFPFAAPVEKFLLEHDLNFVIEQNRDAQLKSLLTLETNVPKGKLKSLCFYGGFPLSTPEVVAAVEREMGK
jgi:2-oxoglutarate ferredoxin oxidoreductase subunit alpha